MQKALERALDGAECVIESARQRPPKSEEPPSGEKSLHDKLYDLYVEECGKEPEVTEELISNVHLLEKLLQREDLPRLVVNLYPGKEGYSLMLKGPGEPQSEPIQLPYEEKKFLEYLDAEELPPALVDLLEKSELNIFHRGCVIAEVRDYRQCGGAEPPAYQSRHVLLRPTMQTLACDVQSIGSNHPEWSQEDKLLLESKLILATAEPLCLDPSVSVACTANRLLYNQQKMNTPAMRRSFKRYSTASLNQQQELSSSPAPHKKSKESQAAQQDDLNISRAENCMDMWKQRPCDLVVPSEVDVEKYATEESSVKYDDESPLTDWQANWVKDSDSLYGCDDDSLYGCEAGDQPQTTKMAVMMSLNDPLISGRGNSPKKARCGIQMSPRHSPTDDHSYSMHPESYLDTGELQSLFEELVPLSAECAFEESPGSSDPAPLSQLSVGRKAGQPRAMSAQPSVPEEGVQYTPPPISLLSSSGNSSSGISGLTPQQARRSCLRKLPSPVPASKPPSFPRKSSVEVKHVSTPPAASLSTANSSQTTPASQVKAKPADLGAIKAAGPVPAAQTVVRGANPTKGSSARARAPGATKPSHPPPRGRPPNGQPVVSQAPSQGSAQHNLDLSKFRPVGVLWAPQDVDIWKTQKPQQLLCQWILGPQLQQPPTSPQQLVSQCSNAQRSASGQAASSAQLSAVFNRSGVGSVLQPQVVVQAQPRSAQGTPGQGRPRPTAQLSAVSPQQPPQPQQVRLRALPPQVAARIAQLRGGQQGASQAKGKGNGGPPGTPRS